MFDLFYEPVGHFDPFMISIGLLALIVLPICFSIGFFQSFKFTDKHRAIGLTLNGLGLGVLLSLLVYKWLTN